MASVAGPPEEGAGAGAEAGCARMRTIVT
jgi:hypothetical protein